MIDQSIIPVENIPPQNIEAEQSILGGMLQSKEASITVMEILSPENFYRESHSFIFLAISELIENGEPADIVMVANKLQNKKQLDKAGGMSYLSGLAVSVPTVANIEYYAKIVREKACLRDLISASIKIAQLSSQNGNMKLSDILDKAEQIIFNISQNNSEQNFYSMREIINDSFSQIEALYEKGEFIIGLPTGFIELDIITTGLQPADLIIVAARPGMGKTSFCLNTATYVALKKKKPVAIFSLESSRAQLAIRMLCAEAKVNSHKLRSGYLGQDDWPKLVSASGELTNAPIFIDDSAGLMINDLRSRARKLKAKQDIQLIIIDYIQLLQSSNRNGNRQQEISEISGALKGLAKELNIPVIAISQLSRAVEQRQDKRPILSDLRESGAIEQDADMVLFLYRKGYYQSESNNGDNEDNRSTEVIIGKQRNGPTGTIKLIFLEEYTKFVNLAKKGVGE